MIEAEFRKFISPMTRRAYISCIIVVLFTAMMVAFMGVQALFLLALFGLLFIRPWCTYRKFLNEHMQQGDLEAISADFNAARPWLNGAVRTGQKYLYCRGQAFLYTYPDILNVYEHDFSMAFISVEKGLCAVIRGGRRVTLCNIKTTLKQNPEAMELLKELLARNPSMTFGYQNSKAAAQKKT